MKRSFTALLRLIGLSSVLSAAAYGQVPEGFNLNAEAYNYTPTPEFRTEQLFAPIDISSYGSGPKWNEGWFGSAEAVYWNVPAPDVQGIGQTALLRFGNPIDLSVIPIPAVPPLATNNALISPQMTTADFKGNFIGGTRLEAGYVRENVGWGFSGTFLPTYHQQLFRGGTNPGQGYIFVPMQSPSGFIIDNQSGLNLAFQPEPALFNMLEARQTTDVGSYEVNRIWRHRRPRPPQPWDPQWECALGVRYIRIQDRFEVDGYTRDPYTPPDADDNTNNRPLQYDPNFVKSWWYTYFDNNIVGPQLSIRYAQQLGPYKWDWELKGVAAANFIDGRQQVTIDQVVYDQMYTNSIHVNNNYEANAPYLPTGGNDQMSRMRFSPIGEFRINGEYIMTRLISIKCGWTGLYVGNTVRSNSQVLYRLPGFDGGQLMGINRDLHFQSMFMHGVNIGVVVNR